MTKIYYARVDELWRKEQKYAFLEEKGSAAARAFWSDRPTWTW